MTKALGIDYGTKKVGIAISNDDKTLAFPREVVQNTPELIEHIATLCTKEEVDEVVIGESVDNKGGHNAIMKDIYAFADTLKDAVAITPEFVPESFTSAQARKLQDLPYRNTTGGGRDMIDASAAALILQTYLDKKSSKN